MYVSSQISQIAKSRPYVFRVPARTAADVESEPLKKCRESNEEEKKSGDVSG